MKKHERFFEIVFALGKTKMVQTVRGGLVSLIPVVFIGSFALVAMSLPIQVYSEFIRNFAGGAIYGLLNIIYSGTLNILSLYMTVCISLSYIRTRSETMNDDIGGLLTSIIVFFILSGIFSENFAVSNIGALGTITAIISGYLATHIYTEIKNKLTKRIKLLSDGADNLFNQSIAAFLPSAITVVCFTVVSEMFSYFFEVDTFYELIAMGTRTIFSGVGHTFLGGAVVVFASSILWFFGIHGSDCIESVMQEVFVPAIDINAAAVAAGNMPTEILTKQFFDIFVFLGGCGATISLLIALFIVGKREGTRKLTQSAVIPMIFNINEIVVFGLPIILNPIMFIPFILTPIVIYFVSYSAMALGIVSLTISPVQWTTPILLGGYMATNSVSGIILQLVNVVIGVLIYIPFIKIFERYKVTLAAENYNELVKSYIEHEGTGNDTTLIQMSNVMGEIARQLASELDSVIDNDEYHMYYQPQYNYNGECIGVEALLRWKHDIFGMIYPPLVIKIATEYGLLEKLERSIISRVFSDKNTVMNSLGDKVVISVNLTGITLASEGFIEFLEEECSKVEDTSSFCIEITENIAFKFDSLTVERLSKIKNLGFILAIDDFTMGQTSVAYLTEKYFDVVKLDGGIVKDMMKNDRCLEIISSIVSLSEKLEFSVLAEFVESEDQRKMLKQIGCSLYQGYLFSPAVSIDMLNDLEPNKKIK